MAEVAICRSCHAPIIWVATEATDKKPSRNMPVDADPARPGKALKVRSAGPPGTACQGCDSTGQRERAATPAEVDQGHELGVAYDPCPACAGTGIAPAKDRGLDGRGLGNLLFTRARDPQGRWIVRYIRTGPNLVRSHFASCPDAAEHRRAR